MSHQSVTVPAEQDGIRVDIAAAKLFGHTRGQIQQAIEQRRLLRNQFPISKGSNLVREGEVLALAPAVDTGIIAVNAPLEVLFEDEALLVVNKPTNLVVHPSSADHLDSVMQRALAHTPSIQEATFDDSATAKERPGIVHRLDKDTTGVLLLAKTRESLLALSAQFASHTTKKEYLALCCGTIAESQEVMTRLKRSSNPKKATFIVDKYGEGREAESLFNPIAHLTESTLVHVTITTGRTHQIRIHAKYLGHPILGDELYYTKTSRTYSQELGVTRQLLHAKKITFTHPVSREEISIQAPVPPDFRDALTALHAPDSLLKEV